MCEKFNDGGSFTTVAVLKLAINCPYRIAFDKLNRPHIRP